MIEGAEDIAYNDGSHAYILNASFTESNGSGEVLDFLRYIDAGYKGKPLDVRSGYVAQIKRAVEEVKTDEEMEGTYMTLAMKLQDVKWEGRQEGRKEGRQEGEESNLLANLKALMSNLNIPADKAIDLLNVPAGDRAKYRQMLDG